MRRTLIVAALGCLLLPSPARAEDSSDDSVTAMKVEASNDALGFTATMPLIDGGGAAQGVLFPAVAVAAERVAFADIVIQSKGGSLPGAVVEVEIPGYSAVGREVVNLEAGKSAVVKLSPVFNYEALLGGGEDRAATVRIAIRGEGKSIEKNTRITISRRNSFLVSKRRFAGLAAFVTPNDPSVQALVQESLRYVGGSHELGYADAKTAPELDRVRRTLDLVNAVYTVLSEIDLRFGATEKTWAAATDLRQPIHFPGETLQLREASGLDGALLLASACEAMGLRWTLFATDRILLGIDGVVEGDPKFMLLVDPVFIGRGSLMQSFESALGVLRTRPDAGAVQMQKARGIGFGPCPVNVGRSVDLDRRIPQERTFRFDLRSLHIAPEDFPKEMRTWSVANDDRPKIFVRIWQGSVPDDVPLEPRPFTKAGLDFAKRIMKDPPKDWKDPRDWLKLVKAVNWPAADMTPNEKLNTFKTWLENTPSWEFLKVEQHGLVPSRFTKTKTTFEATMRRGEYLTVAAFARRDPNGVLLFKHTVDWADLVTHDTDVLVYPQGTRFKLDLNDASIDAQLPGGSASDIGRDFFAHVAVGQVFNYKLNLEGKSGPVAATQEVKITGLAPDRTSAKQTGTVRAQGKEIPGPETILTFASMLAAAKSEPIGTEDLVVSGIGFHCVIVEGDDPFSPGKKARLSLCLERYPGLIKVTTPEGKVTMELTEFKQAK